MKAHSPLQKQQERRPAQTQPRQPGREHRMEPEPVAILDSYRGSGKLEGKAALITGGDSGIGRSVAVHFAREGADVAILYLEEDKDARKTGDLIEREGRRSLLIRGDVGDPGFCQEAVARVLDQFGKLDIVVNNAAEQHVREAIGEITPDQLERTFRTNLFAAFYVVQAAAPHLKEGDSILITTSVTAYEGHETLVDYAATKGALTTFARSLAMQLAPRKIRVNAVAPGPIWTPLIPATFPGQKVKTFGSDTLLQRAGQPCEVGPSYVFLASEDASYITGETIHVNGGRFLTS